MLKLHIQNYNPLNQEPSSSACNVYKHKKISFLLFDSPHNLYSLSSFFSLEQKVSMATSTSSSPSLSFSSSIFSPQSHRHSKTLFSLLPLKSSPSISPILSLSIKSELTTLPAVNSATLPILSFSGEKVGETILSLKTALPDTARAVVHRALITHMQNRRRGTASTLTRAEVRGGGVKPYPQKKTGRARRGSQRTPLRPGGGVIFGPKPKDWTIKINKKEKRLALSTAIASAAESSIVVEDFGDKFMVPKTKEFIAAMNRWGLDPKKKAMFFMMELDENVVKSGRNIGTLKMLTPRSLNLYDVLDSEKLVFTPAAVDYLNQIYGANYDGDEDEDDDGEDEEEVEEEVEGQDGNEGKI